MATQIENPQKLFIKKIVAMALLVVGLIMFAAGFYYASMPMSVSGAAMLVAAVVLLVWKIKSRNS